MKWIHFCLLLITSLVWCHHLFSFFDCTPLEEKIYEFKNVLIHPWKKHSLHISFKKWRAHQFARHAPTCLILRYELLNLRWAVVGLIMQASLYAFGVCLTSFVLSIFISKYCYYLHLLLEAFLQTDDTHSSSSKHAVYLCSHM